MTRYIIDRSFTSSVERTPRVLEIAEGFGMGLGAKKFVIYDKLPIDIDQGDVVYITGQSGSGKSLLLKDIATQMGTAGLDVIDLNSVKLDPNKPVIDQLGATTTKATDLLAKAGISDAWIYIRKPGELSDGQRYRLKMAKMIEDETADVWVADEFGAVLDRVTAKALAFNIQKVARALGKTLIVATTHTDLGEELGASLTVTKRFQSRVDVETHQQAPVSCTHAFYSPPLAPFPRRCILCGNEETNPVRELA